MKLSDREWKEFFLEDLFVVKAGKRLTNADKIDGKRPFVGATDNMNGVTGFVDNTNNSLDKNVLGANYNGAPCICFYHPYECIFTDDVKRLHLKKHEDNAYVFLFMKSIIMQQKNKYSYGYKFNERRMLRQLLLVPVDDNDEPDYQFMEDYMKELMVAKRKQYQEYVEQRLAELGIDAKNTKVGGYNLDLESRDWNSFNIVDIFALVRGVEGNMASLKNGYIPLISARNVNNGLKGFVDNPKKIIKGDCITVNNDGDGGAGLAYYQPCDMALDTHVTALVPALKMSNNVMLFISECLSKLHGFFGHGHSISNKRALSIKIMLPVDNNGKPDYQFMEECGYKMMVKKYIQYLNFLESSGAI